MAYTRKTKRGGGIFNLLTGKAKTVTPAAPTASNLKAKRNYNLVHSKSKVANVLKKPGQLTYTNKERIESEYKKAIDELKKIENPKETVSALKTIATSMKQALQSEEARTAGAITITIPVGVAQLAWKAMWIFVAALAFLFIDLPSMGQVPVSPYLMPNRNFTTTERAYEGAKRYAGANKAQNGVTEYV
jgi:antitoxin component HigA of HigAB toxin-antitoxin module